MYCVILFFSFEEWDIPSRRRIAPGLPKAPGEQAAAAAAAAAPVSPSDAFGDLKSSSLLSVSHRIWIFRILKAFDLWTHP